MCMCICVYACTYILILTYLGKHTFLFNMSKAITSYIEIFPILNNKCKIIYAYVQM